MQNAYGCHQIENPRADFSGVWTPKQGYSQSVEESTLPGTRMRRIQIINSRAECTYNGCSIGLTACALERLQNYVTRVLAIANSILAWKLWKQIFPGNRNNAVKILGQKYFLFLPLLLDFLVTFMSIVGGKNTSFNNYSLLSVHFLFHNPNSLTSSLFSQLLMLFSYTVCFESVQE